MIASPGPTQKGEKALRYGLNFTYDEVYVTYRASVLHGVLSGGRAWDSTRAGGNSIIDELSEGLLDP